MRIAFYAPLKAPDHPVPSGDRRMARLLMEALRRAGHEPWLASRLRTLDLGGDPIRQRMFARSSAAEVEGIVAGLGSLAPQEQPRAWMTYHVYYKAPDWIGPAVAQALEIPYLIVEGSRSPKRAQGPWAFAHEAAEAALDRADAIFYMTRKDFEALDRFKPAGQRLLRLPPFLNIEDWPERTRAAASEGAPPKLLTVAMMRPGDKLASYRVLARALESLVDRPWTLDIVGDGPVRPEVERAFETFGERAQFHGEKSEFSDLADFYAGADLFVWPAVNEAYGMTFLEAQAYGLPIAAGEGGGVADVVLHGETGLLAAPNDVEAFAEIVAALLDAPDRRRAFSERARRFVAEERTLNAASEALGAALSF